MSEVAYLQKRKNEYLQRVYGMQNEVTRLSRGYESLRVFKKKVEQSQSDFRIVNNSKVNLLSELESIKKNNAVAKKYYNEINNILNGIGTKTVAVAYMGLVYKIAAKANEYKNKIDYCNREINKYNSMINEIDYEICEAQNREALATNTGGK